MTGRMVRTVEVLLRDRAVRFTDWQGATLVAQVFWGALFCLPAGFSFTALRISTLTLGLVGVIAMYYLLRHLGAGRRIASFGAAVFGFNPFYVLLSHSFMTDVPFLALLVLVLLLLMRGIDLGHRIELCLGLFLACVSVFIRQIGLMVPLSILFTYPLRRGFGRGWVLVGVLPMVISAGLLWCFEHYLDLIGEMPGGYIIKSDGVKNFFADLAHGHLSAFKFSLRISFSAIMYVGLFSLPFLLLIGRPVLSRLSRLRRGSLWLLIVGVTAGVTAFLTVRGWLMPLVGNQLANFGMGLREPHRGELPGLPRRFWVGITALTALGATLLVMILGRLAWESWLTWSAASRREPWFWQVCFLLLVGVFNLGLIAFGYGTVFDRYLLVFLPLVLGLIVALGRGQLAVSGPALEWLSGLVMAVYLVFGVAATHDYLEWNRVNWTAAAELHERSGVAKDKINGGFEYNNLLESRKHFRGVWRHRPGVQNYIDGSSRPYLLSFEPVPSYEVISRAECRPWLPLGVHRSILCVACQRLRRTLQRTVAPVAKWCHFRNNCGVAMSHELAYSRSVRPEFRTYLANGSDGPRGHHGGGSAAQDRSRPGAKRCRDRGHLPAAASG